jgi:dienelactone hydrolase
MVAEKWRELAARTRARVVVTGRCASGRGGLLVSRLVETRCRRLLCGQAFYPGQRVDLPADPFPVDASPESDEQPERAQADAGQDLHA